MTKVLMVKLRIVHGCCPGSDWFVSWIEVSSRTFTSKFPCYQWVEDGHYIPSSDPILPQNDIEACKAHRAAYVVSRSDTIKWTPHDEVKYLTNTINATTFKDLPKNAAWLRETEFRRQRRMSITNVLINKVISLFRKLDPLNDDQCVEKFLHVDEYRKTDVYRNRNPEVFSNWRSDEIFIQQIVNGVR